MFVSFDVVNCHDHLRSVVSFFLCACFAVSGPFGTGCSMLKVSVSLQDRGWVCGSSFFVHIIECQVHYEMYGRESYQ